MNFMIRNYDLKLILNLMEISMSFMWSMVEFSWTQVVIECIYIVSGSCCGVVAFIVFLGYTIDKLSGL